MTGAAWKTSKVSSFATSDELDDALLEDDEDEDDDDELESLSLDEDMRTKRWRLMVGDIEPHS